MKITQISAGAVLVATSILSCVQAGGLQSQQAADWVLTGGKFFTADDQQPWAEAVAIKDGRFLYVGNEAGVAKFVAESTRRSQLAGRLVIPGIVNSHAHPGYIDVEQYGEISESSEVEILAAVKKYAEENPDDGWLRLCCWPIDLYVHGNQGPIRQTLDAVVPDRPLWFVSESWHSG